MFFNHNKKTKKPTDPVGYFDSRPFSYMNESLEYAKDRIVVENDSYIIRMRVHMGWLFKFVLVKEFNKFTMETTTLAYLKKQDKLLDEELKCTNSVNIYVIGESSEQTKYFANDNTFLTKQGYQQVLVYNQNEVTVEYFNVLPEHDFNLMRYYRTAIFFDLACHDKEDY